MTTATPARPNGWRWSTGCGPRSSFSFDGERYKLDGRDLRAQAGAQAASDHLRRRRERSGQDDDRRPSATPTSCTATRSRRSRPRSPTWRSGATRAGKGRCNTAWPPTRSSATARPRPRRELERITELPPDAAQGFDNFDQWLSGTQLERELKLQEYSVSNRGLRPNLVGTPEQIQERIAEYEAAGLDLLLLQMSPQAEEMDRFAAQVIAPMRARTPELV